MSLSLLISGRQLEGYSGYSIDFILAFALVTTIGSDVGWC